MPRFREKKKQPPVKQITGCKTKGRYVRLSSYFTTSAGHKIPESLDLIVDVCPSLSEIEVQKRLNRIPIISEFQLKKKQL